MISFIHTKNSKNVILLLNSPILLHTPTSLIDFSFLLDTNKSIKFKFF